MKKITDSLLDEMLQKASTSHRRRINLNFHPTLDAVYQRMLNCLMPDTYCQPHKHGNPPKSESFIILKGRIVVFEFDDSGKILDHIILDADNGNFGADILPNSWHSIIAITPAVIFESKDGPYNPSDDKEFANWAPREGSSDCLDYNKKLLNSIGLI
jgi:cupin fold WbuC family metalloprotein